MTELLALNSQREAERNSRKAAKSTNVQAASAGDVIVIDEDEDEDEEENLWGEDFEDWFHESCIQQELYQEQEEAEEKEMSLQIQKTR